MQICAGGDCLPYRAGASIPWEGLERTIGQPIACSCDWVKQGKIGFTPEPTGNRPDFDDFVEEQELLTA